MASFTNSNGKWTHTINAAGNITVPIAGTFVDRDIVITTPAAAGSVTMTAGSGTVTGSNCTLSTSNTSGISVSGKGAVSATAKVTTAGYSPVNNSFATGSSTSSGTATKYITGITLAKDKYIDINNAVSDTVRVKYSSDTNSLDFVFS